MPQRLLSIIALMAISFGVGWFSHRWISTNEKATLAGSTHNPIISHHQNPTTNKFTADNTNRDLAINNATQKNIIDEENINQQLSEQTKRSPLNEFQELLNAYRYQEAIIFYHAEEKNNNQIAARLKEALLSHLVTLLKQEQFNDFAELVDVFLATYYDDIDVLLLLADFNRINGLHIEAINIYQLINTYAYQHSQQEKLWSRFNRFVELTDQFYTEKEDWVFLSNFYSHIETSGLETPSIQYRQALINLYSGDEQLAITQLQSLENDTLVGGKARNILQQLTSNTDSANKNTRPKLNDSQSIALTQKGNQYLVDIGINGKDKVNLLIDTGASMTTLTQETFLSLNSKNEARKVGQQLFNTANGVIKGTVYRFEQLTIGNYQLNNIPVAVLDFSMNSGVEGLLGMNTLGQFRFQIDQENTRLLLTTKD